MIAQPLKVSELLSEVAQGQVLLPEIQRDYVWNGPQVAKLLDSLYHEFPSGQILLWDAQGLTGFVTKRLVGTAQGPFESSGHAKIVLDGQQRLTSLVQALAPRGMLNEDAKINVYFHLETETFERYNNRMKRDPRWISVRDVLSPTWSDMAALLEIAKAGGPAVVSKESEKYLATLQRLKAIANYKFPIEVFRTDDYERVTELFVRINSGGKRLRTAELALAQLALRLPGQIVTAFEHAINEYEESGYDLDARFLIRSLIAVGTGQSRFRHLSDFWSRDEAEIRKIWERTRKGVDAAVNFATHNAGFESSDWLPSLYPLITLTAYFCEYPGKTPGSADDLLRWFYIASVRGRYSTSGETALDNDLKAIKHANPILALLANVDADKNWTPITAEDLDDAGPQSPLFALAYAVARRAGAEDWFTGTKISTAVLGAANSIEVHHIFPKALLRDAKVRRKDIDEIANLAFLARKPNQSIGKKPPEKYLAELADNKASRKRLAAQCVPLDTSLYHVDRFQDFLAERRRLLANAMNRLVERHQADD